MRRAALALLSLLTAFSVNTACAGPVLVIEATGNAFDSGFAGNWHPYHPNVTPEEYAKGAFSEKLMFSLDSCTLSKTGGSCTKMRTVVEEQQYPSFHFDSGWFTPLYSPFQFSITPQGLSTSKTAVYHNVPIPASVTDPNNWSVVLDIDMQGGWNVKFDDFSEIYGKKLRVFQPGDEGYDQFKFPNGSFMIGLSDASYPLSLPNDPLLETWFEYASVYVVPEPSSIALMSVAFAGFVAARRRKS